MKIRPKQEFHTDGPDFEIIEVELDDSWNHIVGSAGEGFTLTTENFSEQAKNIPN